MEEVDWWKGGLEDFRIALDQAVYSMISRNVKKMYISFHHQGLSPDASWS